MKYKTSEEYLKEPYAREIIPDEETGTYTAMISEFPGCIAQGDTVEEAYQFLKDSATAWIEAAMELGQEIPKPNSINSFSGKISLRISRSLHSQATKAATNDGISLNQFIASCISEKVGEKKATNVFVEYVKNRDSSSAWSSALPQAQSIAVRRNIYGEKSFFVLSDLETFESVSSSDNMIPMFSAETKYDDLPMQIRPKYYGSE